MDVNVLWLGAIEKQNTKRKISCADHGGQERDMSWNV